MKLSKRHKKPIVVNLIGVGRGDENRPGFERTPLGWPRVTQLTHTLNDFVHFGQIVPRRATCVLHL